MLGVEGHANTNTDVVLNASTCFFVRLFSVLTTICFPLDDKTAVTSWHKLAENGGKFLGHLFESTLNGFILSPIKVLHELFNGSLGIVQFLPALHQLLLLRRKVVVLLKCLFVDMLVLFQRFIDLFQFGRDLASQLVDFPLVSLTLPRGGSKTYGISLHVLVFVKGLLGQHSQLPDVFRAFCSL